MGLVFRNFHWRSGECVAFLLRRGNDRLLQCSRVSMHEDDLWEWLTLQRWVELSWVREWLLGAECSWQRRRCRTRGRYRIRKLSVEVFPWVCNSVWLQIQFRSHTWHIIPCTSLCCYLPLRQHHLIAVSHEGTSYPLTSIAWALGCCRVLSVCVEAELTAINTERDKLIYLDGIGKYACLDRVSWQEQIHEWAFTFKYRWPTLRWIILRESSLVKVFGRPPV